MRGSLFATECYEMKIKNDEINEPGTFRIKDLVSLDVTKISLRIHSSSCHKSKLSSRYNNSSNAYSADRPKPSLAAKTVQVLEV